MNKRTSSCKTVQRNRDGKLNGVRKVWISATQTHNKKQQQKNKNGWNCSYSTKIYTNQTSTTEFALVSFKLLILSAQLYIYSSVKNKHQMFCRQRKRLLILHFSVACTLNMFAFAVAFAFAIATLLSHFE